MKKLIPAPEISNILTNLDYFIFALVIMGTLLFVFLGTLKKEKYQNEKESFLDLMLLGRKLTLPMFIATLVATWYGGIFGVAKITFNYGIFNFVSQGIFWYLTYFIFAFFIIKKITPFKAMTLPHLVEKLFGKRSAKLAALMNLLNLIPVAYTISIGLLISMIFGTTQVTSMLIGIFFVLAYSLFGGFRAVVFSDIFQFFIMIISILLVAAFSLTLYGTGPLQTLPERYFDPLGGFTLSETLAWGLIALSTLVDPNFYQRCFSARSMKTAQRGIILSTFIWIGFDLCLTFGALYARALLPEAAPDSAYFLYALQILPSGLRGFFLAGITATILSTLDSYIFLAGSTLAFDLVPKKFRGRVSIHHIGVITVATTSFLLALVFAGDIKDVWKTLGSLSSSALLLPVLFGMAFKNKLSDKGFVMSSLLGSFGVIYWRLSVQKEATGIDEIYIGILMSLIGIITAISLPYFRVKADQRSD